MKALSLFTGIGGLDLAAMANGIEVIAMCEIEPFPVQILQKRFPGVPILPDVRKVNGNTYRGTVDVIFGGFPCQDLSQAGRRAGLVDKDGNVTRSGLWFEMLRIISECRPRFVIGENVRGAINAALDTVQGGLDAEGYEVRTFLVPASAIGAPHQRERIFILGIRRDVVQAVADSDGILERTHRFDTVQTGEHAQRESRQRRCRELTGRTAKPAVGGAVNGLPRRVDRSRPRRTNAVARMACETRRGAIPIRASAHHHRNAEPGKTAESAGKFRSAAAG